MNLTLPPPQNSHAVRWHCTAELERRVARLISKLATEFRPSFIIIIIIIIVVVTIKTKMKAHNRWISRTVNLQAASQLATCLGKVNNNNNYYYYATIILYV